MLAVGSVVSGPRHATLEQWVEACQDPTLFSERSDGTYVLNADVGKLGSRFGLGRSQTWRRRTALVAAGLATDTGQLIIDFDALSERAVPRVVSLPTQRTREYEAELEQSFAAHTNDDGTRSYLRADGQPASLADVTEVMVTSSRGTAQRHMARIRQAHQPAADTDWADLVDDALAALGDLVVAAPTDVLRSTAVSLITQLSRTVSEGSPSGRDPVATTARTKDATSVAVSPASRDIGATDATRHVLNNHENELTSSQTHEGLRDKRDAIATDATKGIPPEQREFGVCDWDRSEWEALTAPLVVAWADSRGQDLSLGSWLIEAAQAWPKAYLMRAISRLEAHIKTRPELRNPGGVLAIAMREGRLDYFPVTAPPPSTDPELARQTDLTDRVARAVKRVSCSDDPDVQASLVLAVATTGQVPDLEVLAAIVSRTRELPFDVTRFEDQLLGLISTDIRWRGLGLTSLPTIHAAPGPQSASTIAP